MDEPFVTLLDTNTQWIFNKTMLYGPNGDAPPAIRNNILQMVISASYDLLKKSRQEIIDLCLREVRQALPRAQAAATNEIHGYQGSGCNILSAARRRSLAPPAANKNSRIIFRRGLDRHRLAGHHGRRGAQRLPRGRGRSPHCGHASLIPATGSTSQRLGFLVGRKKNEATRR